MIKLDQFWLRFYLKEINMKKQCNSSKKCLKKNLTSIQFWLNLLISSEEITNSTKLKSISKMPRTEQVTRTMQVFAIAEVSTINSIEIPLKLLSNSIKVFVFLFSQKISAVCLIFSHSHDRHFPLPRSRLLFLCPLGKNKNSAS